MKSCKFIIQIMTLTTLWGAVACGALGDPSVDPPADPPAQEACGNGLLDPGEQCDPAIVTAEGACPSAEGCDDSDPCTVDTVIGEGCLVVCDHQAIVEASAGDLCCPDWADSTTDPDCVVECGNGLLEAGEKCDLGIAGGVGACPTAAGCDDGDPCTSDSVGGDGCDAECAHTAIQMHVGGDQCCPSGADSTTDPDCAVECGNRVVEAEESCDTAIAQGVGACPTAASCDDGIACTADSVVELTPGDPCTAQCHHQEITAVGVADGCCPVGATTAGSDADCAGCGDGTVGDGESCDTAISSGPGTCPTAPDCDDDDPCTVGQVVAAGTCNAQCFQTPITGHAHGDGCCLDPDITFNSEDSDCPVGDLYYYCREPSDCTTGQCQSFDAVTEGKICTEGCNADLIDIAGGCGDTGDVRWPPVCVTRPVAAAGITAVCLPMYIDEYAANDHDGGYLGQDSTLSGNVTAADDYDLFYVQAPADESWSVSITVTPEVGLDPVFAVVGASMVFESTCNNAGGSQPEACVVELSPAGDRVFILVYAAQGAGGYTISASYE